jgi:hypothetical protein
MVAKRVGFGKEILAEVKQSRNNLILLIAV